MTVIELGEVSTGRATQPSSRPITRRDVRRVLVGVVALLTLLGVTGSTRPEPRSLPTLWRIPAPPGPFSVQGDVIYLQQGDYGDFGLPGSPRTRPEPALEARAIADGRLLWQIPLASVDGGSVDAGIPGVVLVSETEQQADGTNPVRNVMAVNAATGQERWRHRGEAYGASGDNVLLVDWSLRGGFIERLYVVRAADGSDVWSYAPGEDAFVSTTVLVGPPDHPTGILLIDRKGGAQVRGLADGKVVRTGRVPWLAPDAGDDAYAYAYGFGDVLIVAVVQKGSMAVSAHDLTTLSPLWNQFTENTLLGSLFDCLGLVCQGSAEQGVEAIDPHSGRSRWRSFGWDYGRPLDDQRLVVESRNGAGGGILDMRTGQLVAKFPAGDVLNNGHGDLVLLGFTKEEPIRRTVQVLQPDNTFRLAGALPLIGGDRGCQLSDRRLICVVPVTDGKLGDKELVVTDVG